MLVITLAATGSAGLRRAAVMTARPIAVRAASASRMSVIPNASQAVMPTRDR